MYAKIEVIGRTGQDVEIRTTATGMAVGSTSLAVTNRKKDKTIWYRVNFYGKLSEVAQKYLSKGSLIFVEGAPWLNEWTGKDGKWRAEMAIDVANLVMLGSKGQTGAKPSGGVTFDDVKAAGFVEEEDVPL